MKDPDVCDKCGRQITGDYHHSVHVHSNPVRVVIEHRGYGCDTGCCGHQITAYDDRGMIVESYFDFTHPYSEDLAVWATHLAGERFQGVTLDMVNSSIVSD